MTWNSVRRSLHLGRIDIFARGFCLLAGFVLACVTGEAERSARVLLILIVIAAAMCWWAVTAGWLNRIYPFALVVEAAAAVAIVAMSDMSADSYFIYVAAPPLLAGLARGLNGAFAVVGVEALTLLVIEVQLATLSKRPARPRRTMDRDRVWVRPFGHLDPAAAAAAS